MDLLTKIPIIVLNYNDYETAVSFLNHFKENLKDVASLIFIDNGSTDDSFERIIKDFSTLGHFIKNSDNHGYGSGNNIGLNWVYSNVSTSKVIVTNPDVIISADAICMLANAMDSDRTVKIASPIMVDTNGKRQITAWKLPGFFRETFASLYLMNHLFKLDKNVYAHDIYSGEKAYVEAVNGSLFMADLAAFYEVGFFDEDTFLYCEENILGYKMKLRGYKELQLNTCSYTHAHNATIGKIYKKKAIRYKLLCDSKRIYLKKYKKAGAVRMCIFNIVSSIGLLERKLGALFS